VPTPLVVYLLGFGVPALAISGVQFLQRIVDAGRL
jgi:hypothetical protein